MLTGHHTYEYLHPCRTCRSPITLLAVSGYEGQRLARSILLSIILNSWAIIVEDGMFMLMGLTTYSLGAPLDPTAYVFSQPLSFPALQHTVASESETSVTATPDNLLRIA